MYSLHDVLLLVFKIYVPVYVFLSLSTNYIQLSKVFARNPSCFDKSKITCVGKYITEIDKIPDLYGRNVQTLYLSQNSLQVLNGIEQFVNVKILSLQDNLVSYI